MGVRVEAATWDRWDDVAAAFGARASRADSCWCQRFRVQSRLSNRDELRREINESAVPVGLLAYVDDSPVGWSRVVPRSTLAGVMSNGALQRVLDNDPAAWWVTCITIRAERRGAGIGTAMLRAALEHARLYGASKVEGHPVDVSKLRSPRVSGTAVFTGTLAMFNAAGFHEIGRTYPSRPVMRFALTEPSTTSKE